jgi:hypothetical protein
MALSSPTAFNAIIAGSRMDFSTVDMKRCTLVRLAA